MKTIIAGSRDYTNYEAVKSVMDRCPWTVTEVVSGKCRGADTLGEQWANENKIPIQPFPYPSEHGKRGGPLRNGQMARYAEAAVIFWNGDMLNSGSWDMIQQALEQHIHLLVVKV